MATNRDRFKRLPGRQQRVIIGYLISVHERGLVGARIENLQVILGIKNAWPSIGPLIAQGILTILDKTLVCMVDPPPPRIVTQENVIDFDIASRVLRDRRHAQEEHAAQTA